LTQLSLVFVPQWSPFQPALSVPSLAAWLKRASFAVRSLDANVLFYEWLFSDECAERLAYDVDALSLDGVTKRGYRALFGNVSDFQADLTRLRQPRGEDESLEEYTARSYLAVQSIETYLHAISEVAGEFVISPYEFRFSDGNLQAKQLEARVRSPHWLIGEFVRKTVRENVLPHRPGMVGLSCIGQEQLYFTLLFGHHLKASLEAPVLVGGTIFSRIYERGALRADWFGRYFDVIVRNEGERPCERLLDNMIEGLNLTEGVPSIVYLRSRQIEASDRCAPLAPLELPVPDFDDLPLGRYLSPEITLPLLSARGCYWGKCEFCHHGMVYGEKYAPYKPVDILEAVQTLADRYHVRHFAFNDEAVPPKVLRAIGETFPSHDQSGWTFTGLIKFEPTYKKADFERFFRAGCRSLYVGLESASERVLELMKKRSARSTIVANLRDATDAGIWMHCFLFFGFPGETDVDAQTTIDFILENAGIVSSYGAGTFSLEHNSPVFHHYEDFGVRLRPNPDRDLDVYYDYDVEEGVTADRALYWREELRAAAAELRHYRAANWIPRELLLCILSEMSTKDLLRLGPAVREAGGLPGSVPFDHFVTYNKPDTMRECGVLVNRVNGRVLEIGPSAERLVELLLCGHVAVEAVQQLAPEVFERVAYFDQDRASLKQTRGPEAELAHA
jgi:Radical SAM superfamily